MSGTFSARSGAQKMKIESEMAVTVNLSDGLNPDIFSDRFKIAMRKEDFKYKIINCLAYLFSQHVNGFFRMVHLDAILSRGMKNLWISEESASYFFPYSMEVLSAFGFIESKKIDGSIFFTSKISQNDFDVAHFEIGQYYNDKKDVDKMLNLSLKRFKQMLEIDNKDDNNENRLRE